LNPYVDDGSIIYVCEGLVTFKISWWKWPIPEVGFGKCLVDLCRISCSFLVATGEVFSLWRALHGVQDWT